MWLHVMWLRAKRWLRAQMWLRMHATVYLAPPPRRRGAISRRRDWPARARAEMRARRISSKIGEAPPRQRPAARAPVPKKAKGGYVRVREKALEGYRRPSKAGRSHLDELLLRSPARRLGPLRLEMSVTKVLLLKGRRGLDLFPKKASPDVTHVSK